MLSSEDGPMTEDKKRQMKLIAYMNMIGALHYVADCTRPNIAYVTGILARYLNNSGQKHVLAAKHCFQYLKGTNEHWLILGGKEDIKLTGYTDSDRMTTEGHKAVSGYIFKIGNATIAWSSKRQTLVSLSVVLESGVR